ncbi:Tim10/DDP family zinc finger [Pseudocohnilembus persalinus]|uniref:Mitochondrial import inner membrane translocase subunit n=1 Tax=Pseudocohnilembus persalinus TaxID=266149 RepID=A0A0V0QDD6_PSEPJ|nr:Tim10/DDP family zinc finger [Pseudocohnilembus persalinus]|eukprot:KRX00220.1 Tim10/DDP family zinc finger [Pseudocohnilembus persalinus]
MENFLDYFGFVQMRKRLGANLDLFNEFQFEQNEKDHEILNNHKNSIRDISKTCFQNCTDLQNQNFTYEEEKCIKNCVKTHFTCMEKVIAQYDIKNNINNISNNNKQEQK